MPRLKPSEVAAAMPPRPRTPGQLANDARLRALKGKPRAAITSDDFAGARSEANISATGKAEVTHRQIEVIPESKAEKRAAQEAFMNQLVTIQIDSTEDPDEPVFVDVGHNGTPQYIQRGIPCPIKLRFLYSLIAAKKVAQSSSYGKDGSGKEFNRLTGRTSTTHRYQVLEATPEIRKKIAEWSMQPA